MTTGVQPADVIASATELGATVIRTPGSTIIVITDSAPAAADLLPLAVAAAKAKCSVGTLRVAIRDGELVAFGKQRSRAIRLSDLEKWIESRRVKPIAGVDDTDMRRRMRRLGRAS